MHLLLLHPLHGGLVTGALLAAVRSHHVLETFAALPLEVLADDGTLRQQVAVPAAGPDCRCRQAEVGRAFLGAGGLMNAYECYFSLNHLHESLDLAGQKMRKL